MNIRHGLPVLIGLIGLLAVDAAFAHATVWPQASAAGAYEKYTIRIPNEKDSPTIRIVAEFPAELAAYYFGVAPGWTIERTEDDSGKTVRAVWSGAAIGPHEFAEFSLMARNPDTRGTLTWRVIQFHADASQSAWTGAPDSQTPAPTTEIR
jgi:uncharacterized protein YcnI